MEHHSKLKLSSSKCSRVHIGKQINPCPDLKVHEDQMKTSNKEKYLESFITTEGNLDSTIENRVQKAWSYYAEIKAIINDFLFGERKTEIGLMLREAMFLIGILYDSEACHNITEKHVEKISLVDRQLEFLYLKAGVRSVRFVIKSRRLNFLKEIHNREPHELIKRIYEAQILKPSQGDWTEIVRKDLMKTEVNEKHLIEKTKIEAKKEIKTKIKNATFNHLLNLQKAHEKVKHNVYLKLETQPYLKTAEIPNKEAEMLTALISQTLRGIKENFHSFYENERQCPLYKINSDSQEHCMTCPKIFEKIEALSEHIKYKNIFGSILEQRDIFRAYIEIMSTREAILEEENLDQENEDDEDNQNDNSKNSSLPWALKDRFVNSFQ